MLHIYGPSSFHRCYSFSWLIGLVSFIRSCVLLSKAPFVSRKRRKRKKRKKNNASHKKKLCPELIVNKFRPTSVSWWLFSSKVFTCQNIFRFWRCFQRSAKQDLTWWHPVINSLILIRWKLNIHRNWEMNNYWFHAMNKNMYQYSQEEKMLCPLNIGFMWFM